MPKNKKTITKRIGGTIIGGRLYEGYADRVLRRSEVIKNKKRKGGKNGKK